VTKDEPISRLMQARTKTIGADDLVETIEAFLNENRLSWAPVLGDSDELIGVISLADLVRFHHDKRDPASTPAWRLCTYRPIAVSPDTAISDVARLMVERHVHHVVVTDGGAIRGVVSALDFVKTFL
jgi:CBS domain-containing protein